MIEALSETDKQGVAVRLALSSKIKLGREDLPWLSELTLETICIPTKHNVNSSTASIVDVLQVNILASTKTGTLSMIHTVRLISSVDPIRQNRRARKRYHVLEVPQS